MKTNHTSTLLLRRMTKDDHLSVANLSVNREQLKFVDPLPLTLKTSTMFRDNFVVTSKLGMVGFFQIEVRSPAYAQCPFLELCQVVIDQKHQGCGYGKQLVAGLASFLHQEYPTASGAMLTVNCKNRIAYRVYAVGGFEDSGKLYHGGPSGPQHILSVGLADHD